MCSNIYSPSVSLYTTALLSKEVHRRTDGEYILLHACLCLYITAFMSPILNHVHSSSVSLYITALMCKELHRNTDEEYIFLHARRELWSYHVHSSSVSLYITCVWNYCTYVVYIELLHVRLEIRHLYLVNWIAIAARISRARILSRTLLISNSIH